MNPASKDSIRFSYLPRQSHIPAILEKMRGYKLSFVDNEWQLPLSDPALSGKFLDTLKWHPRISLDGDLAEAAEKMVKALPSDLEKYLEETTSRPSDSIKINSAFGLSANVRTALIEASLAPRNELSEAIQKHVFPVMIERFGMKYVFPISVNANHVQMTFTMAKLFLLAEAHGIEKAGRLTTDNSVLEGIEMTGGVAILGMIDSLTRSAPIAFTYPINRLDCTWHFYKDEFDLMPPEGLRSTFSRFLMEDSPRTDSQSIFGLFGAKGISEVVIWQMMRKNVDGMNRLFSYLSDIRNYLRKDGTVDFTKQLKAFGTIRLLFADLHGMNVTVNAHSRITFTLGFFDKLSNLIVGLRGLSPNEEKEIFMGLISASRKLQLLELVKKDDGSVYDKFTNAISPAIEQCFSKSLSGLKQQFEDDATERECLERLRDFRNMNHGAFLRSKTFEKLFLSGKGVLPEEIMSIPHLLTWGLLAAPKEFISFDSTIEG